MFGGLFGALGGNFFDANFRAYPVAFIEKESAEAGDKVILPPSALNTLASMHVEYPMLFKVENKRGQRTSHCGVLEFIAQEGMVYMPQWMMDNLLLSVGDLVNLKNVSLPKGSFIKIQPHTTNFLDIANPKAVLETCLRNFTCLTEGDTIVIPYNGENYYIDIQEVKPDRAVSVVETDVEVDFAPPKDYKEPDYKAEAAAAAAAATPSLPTGGSSMGSASVSGSAKAADAEPEPPRFTAFAGSGNRIDGKASGSGTSTPVTASARTTMDSQSGPSGAPTGLKAGKVVFGDSSSNGAAPAAPGIPGNRLAARLASKQGADGKSTVAPKKEEKKEEEPKFQAFVGKGRSLKD